MKRSPTWDERMLVHATLSTRECECVAVVPENFDTSSMAHLRESLPKVPGMGGWEIVRTETATAPPGAIQFEVRVYGAVVSQNMATPAGDTIVLKTVLLARAERLSSEEASALADIAECVAVALLDGGPAIASH